MLLWRGGHLAISASDASRASSFRHTTTLQAEIQISVADLNMKLLVFLLALPAYLALFSITSHARAVNTTSSADPSTRLAPTGSLHHRHGHARMHARFRVRHRQTFKSEGALSGDTSGTALPVKDFEGLRKRELSRLTFFTPGLGACGGRNTNEDFVSPPQSLACMQLI